jgi:two-component system, NtrC family, response regulator AtoC
VVENVTTVTRLLVVSRDCAILRTVWSAGESNNWRFEIAASVWEAMDKLQGGAIPDLLLIDLTREATDGLQVLRWLRRFHPGLPIIVIDRTDDTERERASLRMGACDYLVTPFEDRQLAVAIQRSLSSRCEIAEPEIASDDVEPVGDDHFFIGTCSVMRKLRSHLELLAETDAPVLISGEPGSGKETAARLLHQLSVRSAFPFAKVNCAALPEDLLNRELFGYGGIGSNGSPKTKRGKLELCARGAILLDEITEMPRGVQSSLLDVLRNKRFVRPGNADSVEVDVRILASSSKTIEQPAPEGRILADLYRQLSIYEVQVPPLRERGDELAFLSRHLMHRLAKRYGLPPREFSPSISEAWQTHKWPGNLRELERSVKRYLVAGDTDFTFEEGAASSEKEAKYAGSIRLHGLSQAQHPGRQVPGTIFGAKSLRTLLQSVKAEAERNAIAFALEKTGWNRKAAARLLKVSYRTVLYKIEEYQMNSPDHSTHTNSNSSRPAKSETCGDGHIAMQTTLSKSGYGDSRDQL